MTAQREPLTAQERLIEAYRRQPRIEPCACGGQIVAGGADAEVMAAVGEHYRTPQHVAWRRSQEDALYAAERELHLVGTEVPEALLLRGRRCPCGGHG